jgi:hypothetical protein
MRRIAQHRRVLVVNSIGLRMPLPGRSTHVTRRILRKLHSAAKLVRRPLPDLPQYYVISPLPLPFFARAGSAPWARSWYAPRYGRCAWRSGCGPR